MQYRVLGRTGYRVSILIMGGCGPGIAPKAEDGVRAFDMAVERGLNYVDVAPTYGEAEVRLGPLVRRYRDRLVVAEKTLERSWEGAWRELRRSLERLGCGYFDVYQLHALDTLEDLDRVFGERGAMRAILEAREQGLVKHVGITSHNKAVLLKALERFDFDVVMTPITVGSMLYPRPENDFRPLLRVARDRGIGVIAIKAIARGRWGGRPRRYQTWYEPFDDPEDVRMALSLVLSQEGVVAYSLPCDVRLWPPVLDAAEKVEELDKEGVRRALEYFRRRGAKPLFPEDLAEQLAREES